MIEPEIKRGASLIAIFPAELLQAHAQQGVRLSPINPGSREIALPRDVALQTVAALRGVGVVVLGGDALTIVDGLLEYSGNNWHCNKREGEDLAEYAARSLDDAVSFMSLFGPDEQTLFVLVLQGDKKISA
jgi:hypothetical protein